MAVELNTYISFRDNARDAMEFYKSVFGGKLDLRTFKDFNASQDPSQDNLIMHSVLDGEHGIKFMAADTPMGMEYKPGTNFSMSLGGEESEANELRGYFEKLSAGGKVTQPLEKAMWGDTF